MELGCPGVHRGPARRSPAHTTCPRPPALTWPGSGRPHLGRSRHLHTGGAARAQPPEAASSASPGGCPHRAALAGLGPQQPPGTRAGGRHWVSPHRPHRKHLPARLAQQGGGRPRRSRGAPAHSGVPSGAFTAAQGQVLGDTGALSMKPSSQKSPWPLWGTEHEAKFAEKPLATLGPRSSAGTRGHDPGYLRG